VQVSLITFSNLITDLQLIAVDPAQQKRGIGRILVNWGVQQADKRAKKCYLFASEAGRRLYLSVGFEVVREVSVFGFPHYSMIRQPAETSS
jgi:GNAT superfamily N-acetyltransferase